MNKLFTWIIDKWLAGFISGLIFFILKIYIELPEESKIHFFKFNWLYEILNFNIPLYAVFIIILLLICATRFEKYKYKSNSKIRKISDYRIPKAEFEGYRSDKFGINNNIWTWSYIWNANTKKFEITNLKPNCKICSIPMEVEKSRYGDSANCHKCRLEGYGNGGYVSLNENIKDVEKEIIRRIEYNEINIKK